MTKEKKFKELLKQLASDEGLSDYGVVLLQTCFKDEMQDAINEMLVKKLTIPVVSNQRELLIGYILNEQRLYCGKPDRKLSEELADDYIDNL